MINDTDLQPDPDTVNIDPIVPVSYYPTPAMDTSIPENNPKRPMLTAYTRLSKVKLAEFIEENFNRFEKELIATLVLGSFNPRVRVTSDPLVKEAFIDYLYSDDVFRCIFVRNIDNIMTELDKFLKMLKPHESSYSKWEAIINSPLLLTKRVLRRINFKLTCNSLGFDTQAVLLKSPFNKKSDCYISLVKALICAGILLEKEHELSIKDTVEAIDLLRKYYTYDFCR
jgi:hypothetical protein